ALSELRLHAAPRVGDAVAGLRDLERAPQLLVRRLGLAESQVLRDGPLEEVRALRYDREPRPERLERPRAHIDAVHQHAARRDVEAARDEVHDRALSGAGAADDGRGLPGPRRERQAVEHWPLAVRVREVDVGELDD